jgi:hypothetical protein
LLTPESSTGFKGGDCRLLTSTRALEPGIDLLLQSRREFCRTKAGGTQGHLKFDSPPQQVCAGLVVGVEAFADTRTGEGMMEFDPPGSVTEEYVCHGVFHINGVGKFPPGKLISPRYWPHISGKSGHRSFLDDCGAKNSVLQVAESESLQEI